MATPANAARALAGAAVITGSVLLAPAVAVGALGAAPFPVDCFGIVLIGHARRTRNDRFYRCCMAICGVGRYDWGNL
ncbi:hypothetical protein BKA70DRAFT_1362061 [Coprinopsis sp. MPI-PUGE-AT-0042]|nr:hypothetical protein BKA70DRAFT_1362061 [Coprinopsis sp. MPI-PUGE-AT-0042]